MASTTSRWKTEIAEVRGDDVVVRGYQLSELIGGVSFVDIVFLVLAGELPSPEKRQMLEAMFVSLVEHGISPSTMISRMLASCGTPIQAAIAGGVLSIADWHGGAGEQLATILHRSVRRARESGSDYREAVREVLSAEVAAYRLSGRRLEGFGHPQHPEGDPRASKLLQMANKLDVAGDYVAALELLGQELAIQIGHRLPPNVNGAVAAIALDLGFPPLAVRALVITPRSIGLAAHVVEELDQSGRWRHAATEEVEYTGVSRRPLPPRSPVT